MECADRVGAVYPYLKRPHKGDTRTMSNLPCIFPGVNLVWVGSIAGYASEGKGLTPAKFYARFRK